MAKVAKVAISVLCCLSGASAFASTPSLVVAPRTSSTQPTLSTLPRRALAKAARHYPRMDAASLMDGLSIGLYKLQLSSKAAPVFPLPQVVMHRKSGTSSQLDAHHSDTQGGSPWVNRWRGVRIRSQNRPKSSPTSRFLPFLWGNKIGQKGPGLRLLPDTEHRGN